MAIPPECDGPLLVVAAILLPAGPTVKDDRRPRLALHCASPHRSPGGTMQTLDRAQGSELEPPEPPRRHHLVAWVAAGLAAIVACAGISYAVGSSRSSTKTAVKTIAKEPSRAAPKAAPLKCIPGAAAGSCNIDEAKEISIPDKPLSAADRAREAQQLVAARAAALKYPT